MVRSLAVAVVLRLLLFFPASARRQKENGRQAMEEASDAASEAAVHEAKFDSEFAASPAQRETPPELEQWLADSWQVGLNASEAHRLALREFDSLQKCGATLPYLKKLYAVLSSRFKMGLSTNDAVAKTFVYAKKQLDPDEVYGMYSTLKSSSRLAMSREEALARAPECVEMGASEREVWLFYEFFDFVADTGLRLNSPSSRPKAMQLASAACEFAKVKEAWDATRNMTMAIDTLWCFTVTLPL